MNGQMSTLVVLAAFLAVAGAAPGVDRLYTVRLSIARRPVWGRRKLALHDRTFLSLYVPCDHAPSVLAAVMLRSVKARLKATSRQLSISCTYLAYSRSRGPPELVKARGSVLSVFGSCRTCDMHKSVHHLQKCIVSLRPPPTLCVSFSHLVRRARLLMAPDVASRNIPCLRPTSVQPQRQHPFLAQDDIS